MNFFRQFHRSLVDPLFYREVLHFSGLRVISYLVKLVLLTVVLSGIADTWYLLDMEKGLPPRVENVFKGMVITNGVLDPKMATPYFPPSYAVAPLMKRMANAPHFFDSIPDSFLVIDTSARLWPQGKSPMVIFRRTVFEVHTNSNSSYKVPYNMLFDCKGPMVFTAAGIRSYLSQRFVGVSLSAMIWDGFIDSGIFIFSIFFLATAAYIFRIERKSAFGLYLKIATFASTPIGAGMILVALSGVKFSWTWHVLIFVSTIVMFRAIMVINRPAQNKVDRSA